MDAIISSVAEATLVSKCVLCLLLMMSVLSWAFMAGKWLALRAARKRAGDGLAAFDEARSLRIALDKLEDDIRSPLFGVTRRAVREFNRINGTGDAERLLNDNVRRALHFGIAEEMGRLRSSLALLATTANTAPFIGLFGTVWGIMHSFQAIAQMKNVSLATVAPGIAEAMRALSMQVTPRAMLSRAVAGICKRTLIVNLPGSAKAVEECLGFVLPQLAHGIEILRGDASECARK